MPVISTVERAVYLAAILGLAILCAVVIAREESALKAATAACERGRDDDRDRLVGVASRWEALANDAISDARTCREKWSEVGSKIDRAMANQSQAASDLQKAMDGFSKQWLSKSGQCTLALVQMEEACKSDIPSY